MRAGRCTHARAGLETIAGKGSTKSAVQGCFLGITKISFWSVVRGEDSGQVARGDDANGRTFGSPHCHSSGLFSVGAVFHACISWNRPTNTGCHSIVNGDVVCHTLS